MKGYSPIVRYKFKAGILLGLMAALAILMTDITQVKQQGRSEIQVVAGQEQDQGEEPQEQLTAAKDLVASVSQLTIHHSWHFISAIYTGEHVDQDTRGFELREFNTWFRTLFRLIISPNAP